MLALLTAGAHLGRADAGYSVEIDLEQQTAYLIRGRRIALASPISSGRAGHFTETGSFKITEKERKHFSSLYGKIVDARGRTVVADADADMRVPRGGKFIPAPMSYFMRFDGATGMHAGYLPGYPASHGLRAAAGEKRNRFLSCGRDRHAGSRFRSDGADPRVFSLRPPADPAFPATACAAAVRSPIRAFCL